MPRHAKMLCEVQKARDGRKHMPREELFCVLEDLDFSFTRKQIRYIAEMWKDEESISEIARVLDRDVDEILVALIHLSRQKLIEKRVGGLFLGVV